VLAHHAITEIYYIVEGDAVFVSCGIIVNGSEMPRPAAEGFDAL
jgi:hypothetical protein